MEIMKYTTTVCSGWFCLHHFIKVLCSKQENRHIFNIYIYIYIQWWIVLYNLKSDDLGTWVWSCAAYLLRFLFQNSCVFSCPALICNPLFGPGYHKTKCMQMPPASEFYSLDEQVQHNVHTIVWSNTKCKLLSLESHTSCISCPNGIQVMPR